MEDDLALNFVEDRAVDYSCGQSFMNAEAECLWPDAQVPTKIRD